MTNMSAKMQAKLMLMLFHTCITCYSTTDSIIWSPDGKKAYDKGVTSLRKSTFLKRPQSNHVLRTQSALCTRSTLRLNRVST